MNSETDKDPTNNAKIWKKTRKGQGKRMGKRKGEEVREKMRKKQVRGRGKGKKMIVNKEGKTEIVRNKNELRGGCKVTRK